MEYDHMKPDTWPPPQIPPIPIEVNQAACEANLVIFVGAGVSRLMGCPSWDQFADAALGQLVEQGLITFGDVQQLSHLPAKLRLSISLQISESETLDYAALIQPKHPSNSRVYEYLNSIGCVYVTTNYDRFLDSTLGKDEPDLICSRRQLKGLRLREPGTVIHLHGSIDKPESVIMATPQYLEHYNDEQVQYFLDELFNRHTVLFLGYGLEEWEVLEHMLRKRKQFVLSGFYAHQRKTFSHLYKYLEFRVSNIVPPYIFG
ncbi:SIR2 family protein [Thiolapillus sp.]|uniref:SIR2 family protein n=2 Tax=Thiolapillus sp. TaxID=2017437 RepID=UPI003AF6679A